MGKIVFIGIFLATLSTLPFYASPVQEKPNLNEIDSFMEKVLERRKTNWAESQSYVFHEMESLEIRGLNIPALESFVREYVWIVREGQLVRSPIRANGVKISPEEQREYEEKWKKRRSERRSIERENFFEFKFEPGNYVFAGREEFEGRDLVVIEYYPKNLFNDEDEEDDEDELGKKIEEGLNKTSMVRMWIAPEEHQIVKFNLENVGLDFLPYRWLVRVDDLKATLVMDTPLDAVWLPREILGSATVSTATNFLTIIYSRKFYDYKEAEVEVRLQYGEPEKKEENP